MILQYYFSSYIVNETCPLTVTATNTIEGLDHSIRQYFVVVLEPNEFLDDELHETFSRTGKDEIISLRDVDDTNVRKYNICRFLINENLFVIKTLNLYII